MEVSPLRLALFFFLILSPLLFSRKNIYNRQTATARVCPTGLREGHRGQAAWARLLPDIAAELSVTLPHTVSEWSDSADQTGRPRPHPVPTCLFPGSRSIFPIDAAVEEFGFMKKGNVNKRDDNSGSRRSRILLVPTRWPKFLSCQIRDLSDLFTLPASDLMTERSLSGLKVIFLCKSSVDAFLSFQEALALQVHMISRR